MGTSVAPPFAIIFMTALEEKFLMQRDLKPLKYLRYIDDIFMVWPHSAYELDTFIDAFNVQKDRIKFTKLMSPQHLLVVRL